MEFDGEWQDKNARLFWTAAPNEAALEYHLDRSINQEGFRHIHSTSAVTEDEIQTNEYLDLSVLDMGQTHYSYRIEQIDNGGTIQHSQIAGLSAMEVPYISFNFCPNPVIDIMDIDCMHHDVNPRRQAKEHQQLRFIQNNRALTLFLG